MLGLAVLIEAVDKLGEGIGLFSDDLQVLGQILLRHLSVPDSADVAGNHSDGRFQVVGEVGEHLDALFFQTPGLGLAFGELPGHGIKAAPQLLSPPGLRRRRRHRFPAPRRRMALPAG